MYAKGVLFSSPAVAVFLATWVCGPTIPNTTLKALDSNLAASGETLSGFLRAGDQLTLGARRTATQGWGM